MPSLLNGKTALITGGSKGIGAATSLLLAQNGANVAINYSSDASAADAIVEKIGKDHALAIKGDAASIEAIEQMVSKTVERFGNIDILVCCAAMMYMRDLEHTTEKDFEIMMTLNVKGPYFLAQKTVPYMPQGSHIVFFSSTQCTASTITPTYLLYNTTKGAIEQMTRVMAKDLAPKAICVNAIAPGPTGTDLFYRDKTEQQVKMVASLCPMGRIGKPEDIAEAIVWLSSGNSGWVTGQVLRANGGMA